MSTQQRAIAPPRAIWVAGIAGIAFIASPVIALAMRAPWSRAGAVLSHAATRSAFLLSIRVSVLAAIVAVLLGAPVGWLLARARLRGRAVVRAIAMLPLVAPPVVGGVALLAAFGRRGVLGRLLLHAGISLPFTTAGAVIAEAFVAIPFVVLAIETGLRAHGTSYEEAAATLGASRWRIFMSVTLPMIRPHLVAAFVLAWARALGEFGATITFAGNLAGRTQTLPLAVFETLQTDPGAAIVLSLMLIAFAIVTLAALRGRFGLR